MLTKTNKQTNTATKRKTGRLNFYQPNVRECSGSCFWTLGHHQVCQSTAEDCCSFMGQEHSLVTLALLLILPAGVYSGAASTLATFDPTDPGKIVRKRSL